MPPLPIAPRTGGTRLENLIVRDLMTPNPTSLPHGRTVREAGLFLTDREIGAACVTADDGRPGFRRGRRRNARRSRERDRLAPRVQGSLVRVRG